MKTPNQVNQLIRALPEPKLIDLWNRAFNDFTTPPEVSLLAEIVHENLGYFMNKPCAEGDNGKAKILQALGEMLCDVDSKIEDDRRLTPQAEAKLILDWFEKTVQSIQGA